MWSGARQINSQAQTKTATHIFPPRIFPFFLDLTQSHRATTGESARGATGRERKHAENVSGWLTSSGAVQGFAAATQARQPGCTFAKLSVQCSTKRFSPKVSVFASTAISPFDASRWTEQNARKRRANDSLRRLEWNQFESASLRNYHNSESEFYNAPSLHI